MRPYGFSWVVINSYALLCVVIDLMPPYGSSWVYIDPYASLLILISPYGTL